MRRSLILPSFLISVVALPLAAAAQDAQSILQKVQEAESERWRGVNNYVIDQATMGHRTLLFYEKIDVTAADGNIYPSFRLVPPDEIARRQSEEKGFPKFTPDDMRTMADAAKMTGDALGSETEREMEEAGLPPGLLAAASPNRFATVDPRMMMGNVSDFYDASADAMEASDNRDKTADGRGAINDMQDFAAMAEFEGTESIDGRTAYILRADGLNRTQSMEDGQEFAMQAATLWIDTDQHVPLRLKIEGTITEGDEARAVVIEKHDQNYQGVGSLYMPYRQMMRMSGVMNPEQEAQMVEARKQLQDFDLQMQQMPESQREMLMNMMGPQMEMVRKLASGGGIEVVTDVYEVRVNAGLPDEVAMGSVLFRPQAPSGAPAEGSPSQSATVSSIGDAPGASSNQAAAAASTGTVTPTVAQDSAELKEAQQACLQQKIAEAQEAQKKKRGLGRLARAVVRTAARVGNHDVGRAASDVYSANATADDLSAAAKDLGLTEDEVAACQNP